MVIQGITMVKCMVKCMVHQPHQGGNYQVNSEFMCIWFFWWSSYHHGNTLVLPWYFHHGKNHRNTRSTFLIFFSENYFIWPIKNTIEGYFYYGFTMVLPWCYHGITMGKKTFIIVAQWWVWSCFVSILSYNIILIKSIDYVNEMQSCLKVEVIKITAKSIRWDFEKPKKKKKTIK